jgi:hypothetical protein
MFPMQAQLILISATKRESSSRQARVEEDEKVSTTNDDSEIFWMLAM